MEILVGLFILCACFASIIAFFIVLFVLWQRSRPPSPQQQASAANAAQVDREESVATLLPWSTQCLGDLACQWRGTRTLALVGSEYRGQIASLSDPQGSSALAFHLSGKGRQGVLRLWTSDRQMQLDFRADGSTSVSGCLVGSIRPDGELLDSAGQSIGAYPRRRGFRFVMGSIPVAPRYTSAELNRRAVAEINEGLVRRSGPFAASAATRPLIHNLRADVTREEEDWLIALIGLELIYNVRREFNAAAGQGV